MKIALLTFAIAAGMLVQPAQAAVIGHSPFVTLAPRVIEPDDDSPDAKAPPESVTYQINTTHTGSIAATLKAPLSVKWARNLHGGVGYPVVAGGVVVVAANGALIALVASTGKILWSQPAPSGGGWIGPAYDDGMIFSNVLYTNGSSDDGMFAFDLKTGHQLWSAVTPGQYAFSSPPTAHKGLVYTGGAGTGGTVYAYDEHTGRLVWTKPVANGDDSSPVVTDHDVYVSYVCPQTYKFNAQSGSTVWHYDPGCEGGGGSTGVLYDKLLFVGDSFFISGANGLVLTASQGQVAGTFSSRFTPAFAKHLGFFTPDSQTLVAALIPSLSQKWTQSLGSDSYATPPIVVGSTVYINTVSGTLLGYDAQTGMQTVLLNTGFNGSSPSPGGLAFGSNLLFVPEDTKLIAVKGS